MLLNVPPTACTESELRQFFVAFSHIPGDMQRETLADITMQIVEALTARVE